MAALKRTRKPTTEAVISSMLRHFLHAIHAFKVRIIIRCPGLGLESCGSIMSEAVRHSIALTNDLQYLATNDMSARE